MRKRTEKESNALYETILCLQDLEECRRFFEDLCTPIELRSMEQRFEVAVYLYNGMPYSEILKRTGSSSATVSRVRRSLLEGGAGGIMEDILRRENPDIGTEQE